MPMTGRRPLFETEPCPRCGGSGWCSHCETWGYTCFQCGVRPKEQGLGKRLTKRGAAAYAYYEASLPTRAASALQPGDTIRDLSGWLRVVEVTPPRTVRWTLNGEPQQYEGVDVRCAGVTLCQVRADHAYPLRPSAEEVDRLLAAALAYQATLTKQGVPRKRVA